MLALHINYNKKLPTFMHFVDCTCYKNKWDKTIASIVVASRYDYPVTMHPHGVRYGKDGEGAPYKDGTGDAPNDAPRQDDAVKPGSTHVYEWEVRVLQ